MGATYYRRKDRKRSSRKPWVVVVRWKGEREVSAVTTEQDAKALVQMINKQELGGVNVMETIRQARAQHEMAPPISSSLSASGPTGRRGAAPRLTSLRRKVRSSWRRPAPCSRADRPSS